MKTKLGSPSRFYVKRPSDRHWTRLPVVSAQTERREHKLPKLKGVRVSGLPVITEHVMLESGYEPLAHHLLSEALDSRSPVQLKVKSSGKSVKRLSCTMTGQAIMQPRREEKEVVRMRYEMMIVPPDHQDIYG